MKFKCINTEFSSNCYLVYNMNDVYIIDPSCNVDVIKKYLEGDEVVKGILLTHSHVDHIFYIEEVQKYFDCSIYMHKKGLELLRDAFKNCSELFFLNRTFNIDENKIKYVCDGDIIDGFVKVMYTPGHTIDSLCFVAENKMFTGDTLFKMSVGRTDLYSGNLKTLSDSIKKLCNYKTNYEVYPGHGEFTNLDEEKRKNYYVLKMIG